MEPIGIFFAAVAVLGFVGVLAVLAVNRFHNKDSQARRMSARRTSNGFWWMSGQCTFRAGMTKRSA